MTPIEIARSYIDGQHEHQRLDAWLKGKEIDAAHKAMNISAVSKKPGRTIRRVGKELSAIFETPRIVKWEKASKVVYAPAFTRGDVSSVLRKDKGSDILQSEAVFQTDLYFRSNEDVTEINASTVSAICEPVMRDIVELGGFDHDAGGMAIKKALMRARIIHSGLPDTGIEPDHTRQILIPQDDLVLVAVTMPIDRIEFDKPVTGQVLVIAGVMTRDDLSPEEQEDLDLLRHSMTRESYPGKELFGEMLDKRLTEPAPTLYSTPKV